MHSLQTRFAAETLVQPKELKQRCGYKDGFLIVGENVQKKRRRLSGRVPYMGRGMRKKR